MEFVYTLIALIVFIVWFFIALIRAGIKLDNDRRQDLADKINGK